MKWITKESSISPIVIGIVLLVSAGILSTSSHVLASDFNSVGDIGCSKAAISNLKNLANKPISFFGLGDYSYKCSASTIKPLWDQINSKKLISGNHECEKSGQNALGFTGCKKGYFAVTRGSDTGVIGLNPYTSYKKGSAQYNLVTAASNSYKNNSAINWIVYLIHNDFYPVGCSGSHCHGVDKAAFNAIYEPIIKATGKGFIIQAHTHLTAFGVPKGIPSAICGGGGEDGTKLGSSNGYTYGTATVGYCNFHFGQDNATVKLIGTNNQIIHQHNYTKN